MSFTDQESFTVTQTDLDTFKRHNSVGMCCGMCMKMPQIGDMWRWVYVTGASNTFVCDECDGPEVAACFKQRWDQVIAPILARWCRA